MKKIMIITQVGSEKVIATDYECGEKRIVIEEVINFLNNSKNKGATHIEFSGITEYDSKIF